MLYWRNPTDPKMRPDPTLFYYFCVWKIKKYDGAPRKVRNFKKENNINIALQWQRPMFDVYRWIGGQKVHKLQFFKL